MTPRGRSVEGEQGYGAASGAGGGAGGSDSDCDSELDRDSDLDSDRGSDLISVSGSDGDSKEDDDEDEDKIDGEDDAEPAEGRLALPDEASYVCGACGEEIVVPIDASAGLDQQYVEDCPVCCAPNEVRVEIDLDGDVRVTSRRE